MRLSFIKLYTHSRRREISRSCMYESFPIAEDVEQMAMPCTQTLLWRESKCPRMLLGKRERGRVREDLPRESEKIVARLAEDVTVPARCIARALVARYVYATPSASYSISAQSHRDRTFALSRPLQKLALYVRKLNARARAHIHTYISGMCLPFYRFYNLYNFDVAESRARSCIDCVQAFGSHLPCCIFAIRFLLESTSFSRFFSSS